ncbi:Cell wall-active antibiotics response 4TMS YvqF [Actinopolymorpha cephalotaxi]|uniref:Cell wall-active antibiotics response 4TMS YvqF n=1 Tax=Actinopolymorpha cephalotaxi TaxID=504797 RepID=A0A1I2SR14_9ACTN|nr:DUF1707 domain-containing protein [Actinopolymorpha cephalotaxi]NYH83972.1 hypothetical protein [Actinopolymorpha cephalotaxi]SFG52321.1 Cell wall-active antibiotics response 4TMS YvqF [Actinopolymorpha cephalotaxi]
MSQLPEPTGPSHLRASDSDRQRVAEVLRDAAGEGRLTLEELDERLEGVYAAKTYAELERFTSDLPGVGSTVEHPPRAATAPAGPDSRITGGAAGQSFSIAVLSGATRRGAWLVPPAYTAFAMMGGVQLDLREARFTQQETTIRAFAVMGGIEIVVPDDVSVTIDGVGIMGGFDGTSQHSDPQDGRPIVRVTGFAFWGGIDVKQKPREDGGTQRAEVESA